MKRTTLDWLRRTGCRVLYCAACAACGVHAQGGTQGERIAARLERAGVIDNYFPEVALEVADTLVRAAPGRWRGVQVNQAHRAGWVNIYMVDARRVPETGLLDDEGVENFTAENLRGGALTHEDSATIFLNTAMWKRLTAATRMGRANTQLNLMATLAIVDARGLDGVRPYWDPAALAANTDENRYTGWLMRGALSFVLAHEMGHLKIGRVRFAEPDAVLLKQPTRRQLDERRACPELLEKEARERQRVESAADLAGVELLGAQCRIGADGGLRHQIYMLGTGWYFLASMNDKMLDMGRSTESPFIAKLLQGRLGPQLYDLAIASQAREIRRGAVAPAFPLSHPPDAARMQAIEGALRATPCGGGDIDSREAQVLEEFRLQMCRNLIQQGSAR